MSVVCFGRRLFSYEFKVQYGHGRLKALQDDRKAFFLLFTSGDCFRMYLARMDMSLGFLQDVLDLVRGKIGMGYISFSERLGTNLRRIK
jgi:hypothetical protein